jgi:membrane protease YdiL (CAAX protease family)
MARVADGPAGVNDLVARLLRWRVPLLWWSIALFLFPAAMLAAAAGYLVMGGTIEWSLPETPYELPVWLLFATFPVFALLEEIGWRGYALPRLQRRHSPLVASIILGILWASWHLPTFFLEGSAQEGAPFLGYLVATTMFAIFLTWFYNHTQSILLAGVLHASYNSSLLAVPVGRVPVVLATFGTIGLLLTIVVIVWGRMAKRLGALPAITPQRA